jgi:peptidoglycan/LPS O-acetylase OafA/YrhL
MAGSNHLACAAVEASRTPRFVALDGLRAVAALTVFATHAAFLSGFTSASALGPLTARLNVGVALFFVLSAFLLYRPWVAARLDPAAGSRPRLGRYALRRAVRILPAYWAALLALGLVLGAYVPGALGEEWWIYFGLLQVYSQETVVDGIAVAWSLSTELAFYLVLPLLAAANWRALAGRPASQQVRWELWALAASVAVAFGLREAAHAGGWLATYDLTLAGKWPWFAVGLGLAVASAAWSGSPAAERPRLLRSAATHGWAWWAAAVALLLAAGYTRLLPREVFFMTHAELQLETLLFMLVGLALVGPLVFGDPSRPRSPAGLLAHPAAVWLGTISYGIFLWHFPVLDWLVEAHGLGPAAATAAGLAITLPLAAASWYALERPLLRLTGGRPGRPDRDPAPSTPAVEPAP